MNQKHTPGPWAVNPVQLDQICTADARMEVARATVFRDAHGTIANAHETIANAQLIAAAPDLLEALKNADKLISQLMPGIKHIALQDYAFLNNTLMANTAAIAKATGGQP